MPDLSCRLQSLCFIPFLGLDMVSHPSQMKGGRAEKGGKGMTSFSPVLMVSERDDPSVAPPLIYVKATHTQMKTV